MLYVFVVLSFLDLSRNNCSLFDFDPGASPLSPKGAFSEIESSS